MRIYIQDHAFNGMIIVIASSFEEARELMSDYPNYNPFRAVEVHEIKNGFSYANYGDM